MLDQFFAFNTILAFVFSALFWFIFIVVMPVLAIWALIKLIKVLRSE